MRYTFTLGRGGVFAVASGTVIGTALVFAAGLLVGAAAAVPEEDALLRADSARLAAHYAAIDSAAAADTAEVGPYDGCPEADPSSASWTGEWGGGAYRTALRAVDLPPPPFTGGPDPYELDDADGRTVGTFADEDPALAMLRRMELRGETGFIDARLGEEGEPVFRVRSGSPEEAP
jgi:hypothetical protein